ncbi:MAG: hypothetical protein GY773_17805, partial [Actinomycetia bacterium]|nr:hypothetical protein [Actinomycetes bacterium]
SPGRMLRHYSPATPTVATPSNSIPAVEEAEADVCFLTYDDTDVSHVPSGWTVVTLGPRDDLDQIARTLYSRLRDADVAGHGLIAVEFTGATGLGEALDDRISRAASGVVVPASSRST